MNIALISSTKDQASLNIRESLLNKRGFEKDGEFKDNEVFSRKNAKLFLTDEPIITAELIDKRIENSGLMGKMDAMIFLSRHVSKDKRPAFTAHSIGNWGIADYGGKDRTLCRTSPSILKMLISEIKESRILKEKGIREKYEITMEATHHGPYVECPAVFVEAGSDETEWKNKINGDIIADSVLNVLERLENGMEDAAGLKTETAFGIGGPHYCNTFNKIMEKTNIAFGHICPKHMIGNLNEEIIKDAIAKTGEKTRVILDWKGLGAEKQNVLKLLETCGIGYGRSDRIS